VSHYVENGRSMLKVSDDFKVPDTPAPTWRVVDSKGNICTLDAFKIKSGNNEKREIAVPSYIPDIAKVQVYCAWAEVLLGETSFPSPAWCRLEVHRLRGNVATSRHASSGDGAEVFDAPSHESYNCFRQYKYWNRDE